MKILRRNDDFKKMPERNMEDVMTITAMIKQGWNYCSKSVYKEFFNTNVEFKKPELKPEKVKNKELTKDQKPEKKKIAKKTKADKKKQKK